LRSETAKVNIPGELHQFFIGDRGFKDWLAHVIFIPVQSFEPMVFLGLGKEFGAGIGDDNGGLE